MDTQVFWKLYQNWQGKSLDPKSSETILNAKRSIFNKAKFINSEKLEFYLNNLFCLGKEKLKCLRYTVKHLSILIFHEIKIVDSKMSS